MCIRDRSISIEEDCNAESLKIGGSFKIEGLLNADELELILYGSSQADEILSLIHI